MKANRSVQPWMIVSAAWIIPAILGGVDTLAQQRIWGSVTDYRAALFTAIDWLLYGFLTPFIFILARRFPLARPSAKRNAVLHLGFSLLFCLAWATVGTLTAKRRTIDSRRIDPSVRRDSATPTLNTQPRTACSAITPN